MALHPDLRSIDKCAIRLSMRALCCVGPSRHGLQGGHFIAVMLGSGLSGHGQEVNRVAEKIC